MEDNTLKIYPLSPTPIFIGSPVTLSKEPKLPKTHGAAVVTMTEQPTSHKADAFTNREDINSIITYLLEHHQYGKAAMFTFGINTGYRCGDIIAFRVKDFYDDKGKFRDMFYIIEDKTNKARPVYINKAVRTAVELVIKRKGLTKNNYVFRGDGNRRAYIQGFRYNDDGEIEDVITCGERYDEDGNEREIAPMLVSSIGRWLKDLCDKLGIYGHYSSHALRKTFAEFIDRDYDDKRNVAVVCAALGHSDQRITAKHYISVDPVKLRDNWLKMNLGLEAYSDFFNQKL